MQGIKVIQVIDYYNSEQIDWLKSQGEKDQDIGTHAAIRDTSELMVVYPQGVREDKIMKNGGGDFEESGVAGDPSKASVERGRKLLELKVQAAVKQIKHAS